MKISYMYTGAIGFFVTYLTAILLSYFLKLIKYYRNDSMYLNEAKTLINPELFLPPIAKYIRKLNEKIEKTNLVNASSSTLNNNENKF